MRIVAALTLSLALLRPAAAAAGDVALVVHPSNPATDVKWSEVVAMFRQDQQHWKGGRKIYLVLLETGSPEREIVRQRVYRMSELELKKFWLGKLYRGEIAAFPRVAVATAAKRIVTQAPNALAFIDAAAADQTVKVLRIDGLRPGQPGYRLAAVP